MDFEIIFPRTNPRVFSSLAPLMYYICKKIEVNYNCKNNLHLQLYLNNYHPFIQLH